MPSNERFTSCRKTDSPETDNEKVIRALYARLVKSGLTEQEALLRTVRLTIGFEVPDGLLDDMSGDVDEDKIGRLRARWLGWIEYVKKTIER